MPDSDFLSGLTTLILRPAGRAQPLVSLIESAGGTALVCPLISRAPISDESRSHLDSLTSRLDQFDWVAVTSVNAVDELVASFGRTHRGVPLNEVGALTRWATVGPATSEALAKHGIVCDFEASENSAAGMLRDWPQRTQSSSSLEPLGTLRTLGLDGDSPRVLLPLGDLATTQLEDGLHAMGYACERVDVYRTVSHPADPDALAAWKDGDIDLVVLTSGSIVREFCKQFDPHEVLQDLDPYLPAFVAIGEPTNRAAQASGLSVDIVAKQATNEGLFAALLRAAALLTEEN